VILPKLGRPCWTGVGPCFWLMILLAQESNEEKLNLHQQKLPSMQSCWLL
jgi:hypothetical protein